MRRLRNLGFMILVLLFLAAPATSPAAALAYCENGVAIGFTGEGLCDDDADECATWCTSCGEDYGWCANMYECTPSYWEPTCLNGAGCWEEQIHCNCNCNLE